MLFSILYKRHLKNTSVQLRTKRCLGQEFGLCPQSYTNLFHWLLLTRSAVEDKLLLRLRGLDAVVSPLTHWGLGTT